MGCGGMAKENLSTISEQRGRSVGDECGTTGEKGSTRGENMSHVTIIMYIIRAKNNVRTTVNFRANDGKDRSNDYTSGHYDRPGEYSALNRLIIYAIVRCQYGAIAAID